MHSAALVNLRRRTVIRALAYSALAWPTFAYTQNAYQPVSDLLTVSGTVPAPDSIHKVFAAGPPAAVLLYCLAPHKMLGWPFSISKDARQFLAPGYRSLPFLGRLAGRGSTVALETLLNLSPDLILDVGSAHATQKSIADRMVGQIGIPYALLDGSLSHTAEQLHLLGQLLGVSRRAQILADYTVEVLSQMKIQTVSGAAQPSVYLARSADGLETGLGNAIHTETITLAGARNVAVAEGSVGLGRVSIEQLLDWDPDVILTQELPFYRMAYASSLWRNLRAVRARRLYCAPIHPFGWIDGPPGINRLLGVQWLRAVLTDKLYSQAILNIVNDFFGLFYGQPPDRTVLKRLLFPTIV